MARARSRARTAGAWGLGLGVVGLVAGCSAPVRNPDGGCPATADEPLFGATDAESYLGLDALERAAIVEVSGGDGPEAPFCSGTLVTREWVLTAAHCLAIDEPRVLVRGEDGAVTRGVVLDQVAHPDLDVALLQVAFAPGAEPRVEPLAVAGADADVPVRALVTGDVVALAGYGLTETGSARSLRFLTEAVVTVEPDSVVVSGAGLSGACAGDSGGPLLVRAPEGAVTIAGVLSAGSPTCLERDRYVRVELARDWLLGVVGPFEQPPATCGELDESGVCLYGSAMRCEGGTLVLDPCDPSTRCGFDLDRGGARCLAKERDPCSRSVK